MRYMARLAYNGAHYFGWQRQPNQISVQQVVEEKLSLLLRDSIEVVGCGRTDTGVHALDYVLHFDCAHPLEPDFLYRLNKILPIDIVFYRVEAVADDAHARFDATSRSYEYHISRLKNPFSIDTIWHYPYFSQTDWSLVKEASSLLLNYKSFLPFCKSNTDTRTMVCDLRKSEWIENETGYIYYVESDRFLRGMIRLIVGMCLGVGRQKISMDEVRHAMDRQERLAMAHSVPACGLFLKDIHYPYF